MDRGAWRATVHAVARRVRRDLATKQEQSNTKGSPFNIPTFNWSIYEISKGD